MKRHLWMIGWAIAIALGAAPTLQAQGAFELGGFGSYTRFDAGLPFGERPGGGARLSLISGERYSTFVLEGEGGYSTFPQGAVSFRHIPVRARLLYKLPIGPMVAIQFGGGGVRNDYNDGDSSRVEYGYTGLAGVRFQLGTYMALRVDGVLDYIANPVYETAAMPRNRNKSVQGALSFPLWIDRTAIPRRRPKPEPEEREREREPEPVQAPVQAAAAPAQGPDADRDGVDDGRDACSATPAGATVDPYGCQVYRDSDSDGMIDPRDACPATPAGDVIDGKGCSLPKDADRDGVADASDACPGTSAGQRVDVTGCPVAVAAPTRVAEADADSDGVADARDKCPGTDPGRAVDATGCALKLFENANEKVIALRGVNFEVWKDELTPASLAVLDDVAKQLLEVPSVRIEVAGHTDSGGSQSRNMSLSLARAEAVRAYLVMQGVPAERLVARGYGPSQPLASNKTARGRALNRRVELRRID